MSEAQFQQRITDLCDWLHVKWHHETDSRRSKAGFPDLVLCGPRGIAFVELKTEKGKVTKAQTEWLESIAVAGGNSMVWRPSQWEAIERFLYLLAGRRVPSQ
jgi:hypothetical protein